MNIYDLEKQATPGRFEHRGEGTVAIAEGNHVFILHSGANGNRFSDAYLAELICHCRNHFMEALEALKDCDNGDDPCLQAKIARLEEVEGV